MCIFQFHTYFGLIANTVRRYWPFNLLGCAIVIPQHLLLQMQAIALENPRADCNSEIQQEEQLQFQLVQFNVGYSPDSRIECVVIMPSIVRSPKKQRIINLSLPKNSVPKQMGLNEYIENFGQNPIEGGTTGKLLSNTNHTRSATYKNINHVGNRPVTCTF